MTMNYKIPAWLDSPPTPTASIPVVTRAAMLPLQQLSWQDFERLIVRVVRADSDIVDAHLYGKPGQAQHGIDILASRPDGSLVCYQCKKVASFKPAAVKRAVDAFLNGKFASSSKQLVVCTSFPFAATQDIDALVIQQKRLAKLGVTLGIWDGSAASSLMEKLKVLPDIVDDFFSRPWVEQFNGREAAASLRPRPTPVDAAHLRGRLRTLYTSLFSQHDPSPPGVSVSSPKFKYRYADASVKEELQIGFDALDDSAEPGLKASPVSQDPGEQNSSAPNNRPGELLSRVGRETNWNCLDWIRGKSRSVILGEPGYGKSAFMRYLCLALLNGDSSLDGKLDPAQLRLLPVWMSFAGFAAAIERDNSLGVEAYFTKWLHTNGFGDSCDLFHKAVETGDVLFLVDGLDEGPSDAATNAALDRLVNYLAATGASTICTSRPRGFPQLGLQSAWPVCELNPFDDAQILDLANRWFAVTEQEFSNDEDFTQALSFALPRAEAFMSAVRLNARTNMLARTALLCKSLLEIYRTQSQLPENRAGLYEEMVVVMLKRHPTSRERATGASTGRNLGIDSQDVRSLLQTLALEFQDRLKSISESRDTCVEICARYLEDADAGLGYSKPEARKLSRALVAAFVDHFGILVERTPGELAFVHLTFQEYLAGFAISSRPEEEQLAWVREVWSDDGNRESLFGWFGIHRNRGSRKLTGRAAALIDELGEQSAYCRLKSLDILCALACSDLGLPIAQARQIIQRAGTSALESPYLRHATSLARHLTIGALDSQVRDECEKIVSKLSSGADQWSRARAIRLMSTWRPAEDLFECLVQGLRDPDRDVRDASVACLDAVFQDDPRAHDRLSGIAISDQRPETRAGAIRALKLMPGAGGLARDASRKNENSPHPELILESISDRVDGGVANSEDLERMFRLLRSESFDRSLWKQVYEVLEKGWPSDRTVRDALFARISGRFGFDDHGAYPAIYLMRRYPMAEDIAQIIAASFANGAFGSPYISDEVWPVMRDAFGQHALVRYALRKAMDDHREKSRLIHWHPSEMGGYLVLGGDDIRDLLIESYGTESDSFSNYWIARTLWEGWKEDEVTRNAFKGWIYGRPEMAAALTQFVDHFVTDKDEKRRWLETLVKLSPNRQVGSAIRVLLRDFADEPSYGLVRSRLREDDIWYYHRTELEPLLASMTPGLDESKAVFSAALSEVDGPEAYPFVAMSDRHAPFRSGMLRYVTSGRPEVRETVASTLFERRATEAQVHALMPSSQQDELPAIRTLCLLTIARAVREIPQRRAALIDFATSELISSGTHMDARRLSGVSVMLELKEYPALADNLLADRAGDWAGRIATRLHPDNEAIRTLLHHWGPLHKALSEKGWKGELPVHELVHMGYGPELEQTGLFTEKLVLLRKGGDSSYGERERLSYLSQSALRGASFVDSLRATMLSPSMDARPVLYATRIFSQNLPTQDSELEALFYELRTADTNHGLYRGQVGYLTINTASDRFRQAVVKLLPDEQKDWGPIDSMLVNAAMGEEARSEMAVTSILASNDLRWRYRLEEFDALREWAKSRIGRRILHRWLTSADGTAASCALNLLLELSDISTEEAELLLQRFNTEALRAPPTDGLDITRGVICSWAVSTYDEYLYRATN